MTQIALTAADQMALEFYEANLNYVNGFGLSNLDRPERLLFKKGKKVVDRMDSEVRAAINPRSKDATKWYDEEYDCLAAAYIKNGADERACLADFRTYSSRHSDYAVRLAVNSCKFLDTRVNDAKGLSDYANGLLEALKAHDSARFVGRR